MGYIDDLKKVEDQPELFAEQSNKIFDTYFNDYERFAEASYKLYGTEVSIDVPLEYSADGKPALLAKACYDSEKGETVFMDSNGMACSKEELRNGMLDIDAGVPEKVARLLDANVPETNFILQVQSFATHTNSDININFDDGSKLVVKKDNELTNQQSSNMAQVLNTKYISSISVTEKTADKSSKSNNVLTGTKTEKWLHTALDHPIATATVCGALSLCGKGISSAFRVALMTYQTLLRQGVDQSHQQSL